MQFHDITFSTRMSSTIIDFSTKHHVEITMLGKVQVLGNEKGDAHPNPKVKIE